MSVLFHNPRFRVVSATGVPYNAARLFAYTTATTTLQATYSESTLTTANANPIVSDAGGLFGPVYLDQSLSKYKFVCKTSVADGDTTLWTVDPYENDNDGTVTGNLTVSGNIRAGAILEVYAAIPRIFLSETDQGTNLKNWDWNLESGVLSLRSRTDADGAGKDAIVITRGATTAIASMAFGNATDLPTFTFNGFRISQLARFQARRTTTQTLTNNATTTVIFNTEDQDVGSAYDATTGIFTAAFTGWHHFSAQLYVISNASADQLYGIYYFSKNDSVSAGSIFALTGQFIGEVSTGVPANANGFFGGSVDILLTAGDTMRVKCKQQNNAGGAFTLQELAGYSYFTGD